MLKEATLSEMQQHNPKLVEEIQSEGQTAIGEMTNVRKTLGIKDTEDAAKKIAEMQQQVREQELTNELRERVKVRDARPVIRQLVTAEMTKEDSAGKTVSEIVQSVLSTDDAKAYIGSKSGAPNVNPTNDGKGAKGDRKFTNIVS